MSSDSPSINTHTRTVAHILSFTLSVHPHTLCYLSHTVLHAWQYSTSHTNNHIYRTHTRAHKHTLTHSHTQHLSRPQCKNFFTLSQPGIRQCFFVPGHCGKVLKRVLFLGGRRPLGEYVVNVVCLSLVTWKKNNNVESPTSPEHRRPSKRVRISVVVRATDRGLPHAWKPPGNRFISQSTDLSPRHSIVGLIPNADGLWSGARLSRGPSVSSCPEMCWTPSSLCSLWLRLLPLVCRYDLLKLGSIRLHMAESGDREHLTTEKPQMPSFWVYENPVTGSDALHQLLISHVRNKHTQSDSTRWLSSYQTFYISDSLIGPKLNQWPSNLCWVSEEENSHT